MTFGSLILTSGRRDVRTLGSCRQYFTYRPEALHIQTLPHLRRGSFPTARS